MAKNNFKDIDSAFKNALLSTLNEVHSSQISKELSDAERHRIEFLKIWYQGWIEQDLSGVIHTEKS